MWEQQINPQKRTMRVLTGILAVFGRTESMYKPFLQVKLRIQI
jgi:hypothetical protein